MRYRDPRTDELAAEAARLLERGSAASIAVAIDMAAERLGALRTRRPGHGRVRQHLQALRLASVGPEAYAAEADALVLAAESLMTVLDDHLDHRGLLLVGRVAAGHVDGGATPHVRLRTSAGTAAIAGLVVEFDYPEPRFATADTRYGRFDRVIVEDEGQPLVITRCPPAVSVPMDRDLFTDRPVATATLESLRERLGLE